MTFIYVFVQFCYCDRSNQSALSVWGGGEAWPHYFAIVWRETLRSQSPNLPDAQVLECIRIANNTTALSQCPIAPLTLLTGRTDYVERMMTPRKPGSGEIQGSDSLRRYRTQMQLLLFFAQYAD